jgi:chromosome segregation ATPase
MAAEKLRAENTRLRSELQEQTEAKDAAYQKLYALKEENARLKKELEGVSGDAIMHANHEDELQRQVSDLKQENARLTEELRKLRFDYENIKDVQATQFNRLTLVDTTLKETRQELRDYAAAFYAEKQENARLTEEYLVLAHQHSALNAEAGRDKADLKAENARLRVVVESRIAACGTCGNAGYVVNYSGRVGQPVNREHIPCPGCGDLRDALPKGSV